MRVRLFAVLTILISFFVATTARAETCIQVNIVFRASESTMLEGKIGVSYTDLDGNNVRFIDFHIADPERVIQPGKDFQIGSFTTVEFEAIKVNINDDEVKISGKGRFAAVQTDCGATLPSDDGRLNSEDVASLAILYTDESGYAVYAVNAATGAGRLAFRANRAAVEKALEEANSGTNTLIAQAGDISLWALTSGECQMNSFYADGKSNEFVFDCS